MYGEYIKVKFKGKLYKVFVMCTPNTPQRELENRAYEILVQYYESNGRYGKDQVTEITGCED